jgi:hypothetical protein
MNANALTDEYPKAEVYYNRLLSLPQDSIVLVEPGPYSLGLFYAINTERPDLIPLIYPFLDMTKTYGMADYAPYITKRYGVKWDVASEKYNDLQEDEDYTVGEPQGTLKAIMSSSHPIYSMLREDSVLNRCLILEGSKIVGLTGMNPKPFLKEK